VKKSTVLLVILVFGLLTLWVETDWMWAIEQVAVFGLAGWCLVSKNPLHDCRGSERLATLILLAGVVVLCAVQLAAHTTVDRWETTTQLYTWLAWLAAYWAGVTRLGDEDDRGTFLERVQLAGVVIAVLAILHRTTSHGKVFWMFETGRKFVMGVFPYENQYAAFGLLVLPSVLVRAMRGRSHRLSWMVGGGVMVASVVSSSSVAGAALVLLETLVIVAMVCRELHWPWTRRIALGGGILALAAAFGSVSGWADILADLERHNAMEVRRQLTLSTLEMAREHPLLGWGMGTWTQVYPAYARFDDGVFDNAAHNDWAQWASDGGVPMLMLMAGFALALVKPAVRSVWGIGFLFVLGYSVMEFHFQERPQFGCFFFGLAGVLMAGTGTDTG
jgi:O-antigen ligase